MNIDEIKNIVLVISSLLAIIGGPFLILKYPLVIKLNKPHYGCIFSVAAALRCQWPNTYAGPFSAI